MSQDLAVVAERLRDDLEAFRKKLRTQYPKKTTQVQSASLKRDAAALAERGLVDLTGSDDFAQAVGAERAADLTIDFQRLLNAANKSAQRATYEEALAGILKDFATHVIVPLKQRGARRGAGPVIAPRPSHKPTSIFLGHSFSNEDKDVVDCVKQAFDVLGIPVVTGERPKADRISEKVKRLIDAQPVFAGLYTRRDKIAGKKEWTASAWVIEEKAFAVAKRKKLILLKEDGISSIGGIQGDYEYVVFDRAALEDLVLKIARLFTITVEGFAE
jgi:hypothetical protein